MLAKNWIHDFFCFFGLPKEKTKWYLFSLFSFWKWIHVFLAFLIMFFENFCLKTIIKLKESLLQCVPELMRLKNYCIHQLFLKNVDPYLRAWLLTHRVFKRTNSRAHTTPGQKVQAVRKIASWSTFPSSLNIIYGKLSNISKLRSGDFFRRFSGAFCNMPNGQYLHI